MQLLRTLRILAPFMAAGYLAGALYGYSVGQTLYFGGMGFAAGTMMGSVMLARQRREALKIEAETESKED